MAGKELFPLVFFPTSNIQPNSSLLVFIVVPKRICDRLIYLLVVLGTTQNRTENRTQKGLNAENETNGPFREARSGLKVLLVRLSGYLGLRVKTKYYHQVQLSHAVAQNAP